MYNPTMEQVCVWFGFFGILTFESYLMPKTTLYKNSIGTI